MRTTPTNTGGESKGIITVGSLHLEGDSYLYLVVGIVVSMLLFVACGSFGWFWRITLAAMPLGIALFWVKKFLTGRPPHYQADIFEGLVVGPDFDVDPTEWAKTPHPRAKRVRGIS